MNQEYLKLYQENNLDITFSEYILLVLINEQNYDILETMLKREGLIFHHTIVGLEEKGYAKWHGETIQDISLRKKGEDLFGNIKKESKSDITEWIDEWRNLFPEGVNNLGYRYRGNRSECLKKMIKFVASNHFTKEEIFEATKHYIERFSVKGYAFMEQSHYFIEKKGRGSSLESECENLNKSKPEKAEAVNYGRKII